MERAERLLDGWKRLSEQGIRRRDAAATLGVTEAELVAAHVEANLARRLRPEWAAILEGVPALGTVMALTRNDACVIEKTGTYGKPEFANAHLGQVTGPDIDLRLFLQHWSSGFAVTQDERVSLEFFGPDGNAVHKIIAREQTNRDAFDALVAAFADDETTGITVAPAPAKDERYDVDIDITAYRDALAGMASTHDFFGIMRRFHLTREQALRLGGTSFAEPVAATSYRDILQNASERKVPIMVFVGNDGVIEIHTGPVHRVVEHSGFFNVLDTGFNLHLLEKPVARAWVVRKPTHDGIISSLEIFDAAGNLIVQFFGERHAREAEREDWRTLLRDLSPLATRA